MTLRVADAAGIISAALVAEFWFHYFVLFKYDIGYPLGLGGIFVLLAVAFIGGLVASYRRWTWGLCSLAAVASFFFVMAHIH